MHYTQEPEIKKLKVIDENSLLILVNKYRDRNVFLKKIYVAACVFEKLLIRNVNGVPIFPDNGTSDAHKIMLVH